MFASFLIILLFAGCGRSALHSSEFNGEMVYYGAAARIRGFDPVKAGDVASALAVSKIYEGLLQYAYLERPYRVEPLLAEAMPEVSDDGLTYTFKIRKGIFFQDDRCFAATAGKGRELTAEDFVYSIKRIADAKNGSSGYWAFNNRIVGLDEFRTESSNPEPTGYAREVEGLKALDRYTLQFKLKEPYPQLLWVLTMPYVVAVPREAVEFYGREFVNHPVGTGAFILQSYRQNYRYEFVRNPKWKETGRIERYPSTSAPGDSPELLGDAGQHVPFLDRIVQYVVEDASTSWLMFLTGGLESAEISRDNWDAVFNEGQQLNADLERRGIRLVTAPTLDTYFTGFNMDDPIVGRNKKLRQAMSCAFNTAEWVKFQNGRVRRPNGPIPPGVAGYSDREAPYSFNLDQARQLLAEADYPDGKDPATGRRLQLTLEVGSADNPEFRQAVELFVNFMDRIGIVIKPSYNNRPAFFEKLERRQAQMFNLSWIADYPDAENFLQLFYSHNASPGPNRANYSNPEFDRLYEKARTLPDGLERTELYRKMADLVVEDAPWIFTSNPLAYVLHHDWLKNYKYHDFPYGMFKYYKVDTAQRVVLKEKVTTDEHRLTQMKDKE
jgi:oligopeptide transport system substrate-binding protein